jgi:hypothetical protein
MSEGPRVVYRARDFAMPEAELSALAVIYRFVLFDSQASKGGTHEVATDWRKQKVQDKTRKERT